jgi:DNA polymerase III alpha subunit
MTQADKDWLDEAFAAYAGYGFNSAHATVYGITAYRCAYLVVHHPVEFHTSLLAVASGDPDKEAAYLRAAISRGIKVLGADINISGDTYTIDKIRGAVRRGLQSVPGVGKVTATELARHQPYASLVDLCERVDHTKVTGVKTYRETRDLTELNGALEKLHSSGVLDSLV